MSILPDLDISIIYQLLGKRVQDFPGLVGIEVKVPFITDIFHNDKIRCSETAPTEGTLRVFPDVMISNAYIILRPFFRPIVPLDDPTILDPKNWELGEVHSTGCFCHFHLTGTVRHIYA